MPVTGTVLRMYIDALAINADSFESITESTIAVIVYFLKQQILNSWPLSGHRDPPLTRSSSFPRAPVETAVSQGPRLPVVQEGPELMTPGQVSRGR